MWFFTQPQQVESSGARFAALGGQAAVLLCQSLTKHQVIKGIPHNVAVVIWYPVFLEDSCMW